jgi:hypothetical protein
MSGLRRAAGRTTCTAGLNFLLIAEHMVRFSPGWRRILSAWALVLILILAGFGAVELAPSLGVARTGPELRGARIPQFDPFDLGPPAFEKSASEATEADFDAEAHFTTQRR